MMIIVFSAELSSLPAASSSSAEWMVFWLCISLKKCVRYVWVTVAVTRSNNERAFSSHSVPYIPYHIGDPPIQVPLPPILPQGPFMERELGRLTVRRRGGEKT